VGVDHGGAHILVAEQFLDGADVVAILEEVGGKRMAEGVGTDGFACILHLIEESVILYAILTDF